MSVREAKLTDRPHVQRLLQAALVEERATGSDTLPTPKSLRFQLDYFNSYLQGSRFGVCLLWQPPEEEPSGLVLLGEQWDGDGYDRDWGRAAWLWNLYVEPAQRLHRVAGQLLDAAHAWVTEAGFETVVFNIPSGMQSPSLAAAFDAVPRGVWYTVDLNPARNSGA